MYSFLLLNLKYYSKKTKCMNKFYDQQKKICVWCFFPLIHGAHHISRMLEVSGRRLMFGEKFVFKTNFFLYFCQIFWSHIQRRTRDFTFYMKKKGLKKNSQFLCFIMMKVHSKELTCNVLKYIWDEERRRYVVKSRVRNMIHVKKFKNFPNDLIALYVFRLIFLSIPFACSTTITAH